MPTVCQVQSTSTKKGSVTDSDLQSEGDNPVEKLPWETDCQKVDSEQFSVNLPTTDDLEMIDIDSLFDEDTDDRPVLSQEEAWELFA